MVEALKLFNVFGMATIRRERIDVLGTAILPSGKSLERTMTRDLEKPIEQVGEGESCTVLFAAKMAGNGKAEIAVQQVSARVGGPDVFGEPAVRAAIGEVIKKLRESAS